jgi:geranylgeranyl pyrophosphate synthase
MNTAQAQLGAVLAAGGPELTRLLERTEARLSEVGDGHGKELARHSGATLSAGGKRLRPMLVFLCANGDGDDRLVAAAAAVELLHMATLVHDDVLDRAPLRSWRRPAAPMPCARYRRRRAHSPAAS